jgi:Flp pilus assembly protein TadG
MAKGKEHLKGERGQSLTELALSMTILLILLAGVVDLGRAFFTFMILRDAVKEGAVYASINPSDTSEIKDHVVHASSMVENLITPNDVSVQIIGDPCAGYLVRVDATISNFQITMPFLGTIIGTQAFPINAYVIETILMPGCF